MALGEDAQEMLAMFTRHGFFTPRHVPPGVLTSIGYLQATRGGVPDGFIGKICLV